MAVVGLHRQALSDSFTVRVPVSDVILSKKYNSPMSPSATRFTSDIMLLKLAHPVQFNDAVSPVCLPSLFQVLPSGKPCYSSGWGRLSSRHKIHFIRSIVYAIFLPLGVCIMRSYFSVSSQSCVPVETEEYFIKLFLPSFSIAIPDSDVKRLEENANTITVGVPSGVRYGKIFGYSLKD